MEVLRVEEKDTYNKIFAGLRLLHTEQGNTGMPKIVQHVKEHQRKAVLNFMAMMENAVHAKSYSNIFLKLASTEEINEVFKWITENKFLQQKARLIVNIHNNIKADVKISLYKSMVASVYLESFLFYSGFFFSMKGNGNKKAIVEHLKDEDFIFEGE